MSKKREKQKVIINSLIIEGFSWAQATSVVEAIEKLAPKKKKKDKFADDDARWEALSSMPEPRGLGDAPLKQEGGGVCYDTKAKADKIKKARTVLRFQLARELLPVLLASKPPAGVDLAYKLADELIRQGEVKP